MRPHGIVLALLGTLAMVACGSPADPVIATIDGDAVRYRQFHRWVEENVGQTPDGLEEVALAVLFEEMLDELCLVRMADDDGFASPDDDPRDSVARLVAALDVGRADRSESGPAEIGDADSRSVGQILVLDQETAEAVRQDILNGGDPEAEALKWQARGVGVIFGGLQHDVRASDLPAVFARAVFALGPGEISEVLDADYGYHLFFLPTTRASGERAIEPSSVRVIARQARARYNVVLFGEHLPFRPLSEDSGNATHD